MNEQRPLLIGMNNPYGSDPYYALYPLPENSAGGRLYGLIKEATGLSRSQYVRAYDRINLVEGAWSISRARYQSSKLLPSLIGRRVVLLGKSVQEAFGLAIEPLQMLVHKPTTSLIIFSLSGEITFYAVPHTSGRNPWYNSADNRHRTIAFFRHLHQETRGEEGELTPGDQYAI